MQGFVYIWFDKKKKRYYIGCHWGREDDGYVCSSSWMIQAYRKRPEDFKRRILERCDDRKTLLEREHVWLKMIKDHELKTRYYNLTNHRNGHWSSSKHAGTVREKIKKSRKDPEFIRKMRELKLGDKNPMKRPDVVAKRSESVKGRILWNLENKDKVVARLLAGRVKNFKIQSPKGEVFEGTNITKFCREHSISRTKLYRGTSNWKLQQ